MCPLFNILERFATRGGYVLAHDHSLAYCTPLSHISTLMSIQFVRQSLSQNHRTCRVTQVLVEEVAQAIRADVPFISSRTWTVEITYRNILKSSALLCYRIATGWESMWGGPLFARKLWTCSSERVEFFRSTGWNDRMVPIKSNNIILIIVTPRTAEERVGGHGPNGCLLRICMAWAWQAGISGNYWKHLHPFATQHAATGCQLSFSIPGWPPFVSCI